MKDKTAGMSLVTVLTVLTVLSIALGLCGPAAARTIGISGPTRVGLIPSPAFVDSQSHFLPGDFDVNGTWCAPLPIISFSREYGVVYGEKRPFVVAYQAWVQNSNNNINMSFEFDSETASVPDVQLVRYSTYKEWSLSEYPYPQLWVPGMIGPFVREVEVAPGDNFAGNALTFRMDETQPNNTTWFVEAQFMFTPPAETGFVDPFSSTVLATETPDPAYTEGGGIGITIITRVGMAFNLSIIPEPSMIGLLALGGSGLLTRRHRSK